MHWLSTLPTFSSALGLNQLSLFILRWINHFNFYIIDILTLTSHVGHSIRMLDSGFSSLSVYSIGALLLELEWNYVIICSSQLTLTSFIYFQFILFFLREELFDGHFLELPGFNWYDAISITFEAFVAGTSSMCGSTSAMFLEYSLLSQLALQKHLGFGWSMYLFFTVIDIVINDIGFLQSQYVWHLAALFFLIRHLGLIFIEYKCLKYYMREKCNNFISFRFIYLSYNYYFYFEF